jgi:hypothetical protein
MGMKPSEEKDAPNETVSSMERSLLGFLSSWQGGAETRERLLSQLKSYTFNKLEHQVLFDCVRPILLNRPELVREQLPARLVRAGFPDFDLDPFLQPCDLSDEDAASLCRKLLERGQR